MTPQQGDPGISLPFTLRAAGLLLNLLVFSVRFTITLMRSQVLSKYVTPSKAKATMTSSRRLHRPAGGGVNRGLSRPPRGREGGRGWGVYHQRPKLL